MLGTTQLCEVRCVKKGKVNVAFAPRGVLSSGAIREFSPCVVPGWGTGFRTEEGDLLAEVAEQWP